MTLNWVKQDLGIGTWLTKVSSDGTKFLAAQWEGGYVYLSTGNNIWTKANIAGGISLDVESCAISGNGQYMLVGEHQGKVYLSSDGGTSWSETVPPGTLNGTEDWYSVAINYSGQYMLAGDWYNDNLYFSNDYGVSWALKSEGNGYCDAACINDSGSVLVACGWEGTFISTNLGSSWTAAVPVEDFYNFSGVTCTALGDIIYLISNEQYILRSSNYGATWIGLAALSNAFYVTCSDDDSIVLVADLTAGLGSSTDKVNWTFELPTMWDVSSNASGAVVICGQAGGYVYISTSVNFEFFSNHVVLHLAEAKCLKVLGYPLFDNVQIHRYTDTTSGATPNSISIDNATLVSADIAADVLAKTAEYYSLRYQQDVTLFPDTAIKQGDIRMLSSLYGKFVNGITEKLEGDLTGGYLTAAKIVGQERMAS